MKLPQTHIHVSPKLRFRKDLTVPRPLEHKKIDISTCNSGYMSVYLSDSEKIDKGFSKWLVKKKILDSVMTSEILDLGLGISY